MKKFILVEAGSDSRGIWAHQSFPGLFESPSSALAELKKEWPEATVFHLIQLDTGTYQVLHETGDLEGLIVPIETRRD